MTGDNFFLYLIGLLLIFDLPQKNIYLISSVSEFATQMPWSVLLHLWLGSCWWRIWSLPFFWFFHLGYIHKHILILKNYSTAFQLCDIFLKTCRLRVFSLREFLWPNCQQFHQEAHILISSIRLSREFFQSFLSNWFFGIDSFSFCLHEFQQLMPCEQTEKFNLLLVSKLLHDLSQSINTCNVMHFETGEALFELNSAWTSLRNAWALFLENSPFGNIWAWITAALEAASSGVDKADRPNWSDGFIRSWSVNILYLQQ